MQIGSGVAKRLVLVGLVLLAAAPSRAIEITLDVLIGGVALPGGAGHLDSSALGCGSGTITATCSRQNFTVGSLLFESVNLSLDTDPIVNGVVAVQNLAGSTQQFTLIFTLPVVPILSTTVTGGSTSGGVTDNNGNGGTLSSLSKGAIFTAMIDGVAYQTLYPHLTSVSAAGFDSADLTEADFGTPIPSQPGPAVATSIGIKYDFTLTSQDSASFTGVFNVQPIPEPATALLLGLGLVAVARVGRRR